MIAKDIKLNPDNPRVIKDDKFKKLVQSLKEFPEMAVVRPVVINEDNMILGGNMRYKAMIEAGWDDIPVTKVKGWTKEQEREFIIKDNVSGGEWDWDVLANEWDADLLDNWGLDLPAQFGDDEVEEDEAPEVSDEPPVSKLGEIYQLGRHRVMCGDSTEQANVELLLDGAKADMVFTDPPYNVNYKGSNGLSIENDNSDDATFYQFLYEAFNNCSQVAKAGAAIYVCHADLEGFNFRKAFKESGYQLRSTIIWNKNALVMGRADYHWKHEPILYGWKEGAKHSWYGDRSQTTVWDISKPSVNDNHPTMKPIELIAKALNNSSKSDDVVLDLFLGSGSTLIACEQTDRTCYGMELDPRYVDVIRKRYAKFTNNNELPNNWEELTPAISGKEQGNDE